MIAEIKELAKILKVLGDRNRLGILFAVGRDSRSVSEIIKITRNSQTLVSFHLRTLREAAIVKTERSGPFVYYSLTDPDLIDLLMQLSERMKRQQAVRKEVRVPVPK